MPRSCRKLYRCSSLLPLYIELLPSRSTPLQPVKIATNPKRHKLPIYRQQTLQELEWQVHDLEQSIAKLSYDIHRTELSRESCEERFNAEWQIAPEEWRQGPLGQELQDLYESQDRVLMRIIDELEEGLAGHHRDLDQCSAQRRGCLDEAGSGAYAGRGQ